ncbi:MAG: response regulator [Planctomycetales bacterium]
MAEDDAMPRKVLVRMLESWGYDVLSADSGASAWDRFQMEPTEMVVSDWMMPEMDGVELCRMVRSAEHLPHVECGAYTYFLLLTSRSDKESLIEALSAGADDFVSKPFDEQELKWRIRAGERIVNLSRDLSKEVTRADDYVKQVNFRMTTNVQRLLETLGQWTGGPNAPEDGEDERQRLKQELATELMNVVYDWVSALDAPPEK